MGQTTTKSIQFQDAAALFSNDELQRIQDIFLRLSVGKKNSLNSGRLQEWTNQILPKETTTRLYSYMSNIENTQCGHESRAMAVSEDAFVIAMSHLIKGSVSNKASILCHLATESLSTSAQDLTAVVEVMLSSYLKLLEKYPQFESWKISSHEEDLHRFSAVLSHDLLHDQDGIYTEDRLEKWLASCPMMLHIMDVVFRTCFKVITDAFSEVSPMIPFCNKVNWSKYSTIMSVSELMLINQNLPVDLRDEWRPLFNSAVHGESFSRLIGHILDKGPTVIIIRDTDGHVFGGFGTESWAYSSQFVGNSRCFLFSLKPKMGVFHTTGYNDHFMYLNQFQETMPNGLGFGGQFGYSGLWLDSEYGVGHSKAEPVCTTYNSPQLSQKAQFRLDTVEVWAVGPEPRKESSDEEDEKVKKSILDKDPAAKAMLEMVGKKAHSDGMRESDATAGNPEEHALYQEHS